MQIKTRNTLLLLLTAAVWGLGFVVQTTGGDALGAFAYNGIRNFIGSTVLLPLIIFRDKTGISHKPKTSDERKILEISGVACGFLLFLASSTQQIGITMGTESGKAGFLTAVYILLVPILGLFLGKKCGLHIWIAVFIMLAGLYLLCVGDGVSFVLSDMAVLLCALLFSLQIMAVDHFGPLVDGVRLACRQFMWVGIFSIIPALVFDIKTGSNAAMWWANMCTSSAVISLLYGGCISSGVGYTLQIIAQKGMNPTVASLLMSLESVFSVIFGFIFLHQILSFRELMGCMVMFVAIILAQLPISNPNIK